MARPGPVLGNADSSWKWVAWERACFRAMQWTSSFDSSTSACSRVIRAMDDVSAVELIQRWSATTKPRMTAGLGGFSPLRAQVGSVYDASPS